MKMKQMIYTAMVVTGVALMGAQGAFADVTMNYRLTSSRGESMQTIQYRDQQHVRLDMRDGRSGRLATMIRRGDKVYAIAPGGEVIEMTGEMGGMMGALGGMLGGGSRRDGTAGMQFRDTGRSERVAGYRGEVYRYTGNGETHEVVLTKDRNLAEVFQAWIEMNKLITQRSASDRTLEQIQQNTPQRHTGLLRMDRTMVLVSVGTGSLRSDVFDLPGKPMDMSGGGRGTPSRYRSEHKSGYKSRHAERSRHEESVVEKDAKDIGRNSVNEAHQSTKQGIQNGISDQIEKGIGGLMNGLFGR